MNCILFYNLFLFLCLYKAIPKYKKLLFLNKKNNKDILIKILVYDADKLINTSENISDLFMKYKFN